MGKPLAAGLSTDANRTVPRRLEVVSSVIPEPLPGPRFDLVSDAHIHPGKSRGFPCPLASVFVGTDAIIALGDLGENSGLVSLEAIAPVIGVIGADDAIDDVRLSGEIRLCNTRGHGTRSAKARLE